MVRKVENKIIISGNKIEYYDYEFGYWVGFSRKEIKNKYLEKLSEEEREKIKQKKKVNEKIINEIVDKKFINSDLLKQRRIKIQSDNKKKSDNRAKTKVKRLINANIGQYGEKDKFLTLTVKANEVDRNKMNDEFKKFIKRLKYHSKKDDIKYIAVIEKQKRGAIHYHVVIFNLPYIAKLDLQEIWRHGFVKINAIENYEDLGLYLIKYMTKDIETERAENQKRYLCSNGLIKPTIIENIDIDKLINSEDLKVVFTKEFESEYVGKVVYKYCKK